MASVRSQILAAVIAALDASGKPTALMVVERSRLRALAPADLPALVVYAQSEQVTRDEHDDSCFRTLTLKLEHWATGYPYEEQLETSEKWATAAMEADREWGGLAYDTREVSIEWEGTSPEADFGRAAHTFEIDYYTSESDQETQT